MKIIKYTLELSFRDDKGKQIKLSLFASSDKDLYDSLKRVLEQEQRWSLRKLLNF